jgi:hypothetical protein
LLETMLGPDPFLADIVIEPAAVDADIACELD